MSGSTITAKPRDRMRKASTPMGYTARNVASGCRTSRSNVPATFTSMFSELQPMDDAQTDALREFAEYVVATESETITISGTPAFFAGGLLDRARAALASPRATGSPEPDATVEAELGGWMQKVRDAVFYTRVAARSKGYALAVHGTLRRDVDIVAVPWTDEASDPDELMEHIVEYLRSVGICYGGDDTGTLAHAKQSREVKPFGRVAYAIPLKGIPAPYLDLSVAPRILASPSLASATAGDTERLNWLEAERCNVVAAHAHFDIWYDDREGDGSSLLASKPTLREAVDAAMKHD